LGRIKQIGRKELIKDLAISGNSEHFFAFEQQQKIRSHWVNQSLSIQVTVE
jgi:hypothetical protein